MKGGGREVTGKRPAIPGCPAPFHTCTRKQCLFQALLPRPSFLSIRGRNARALHLRSLRIHMQNLPNPQPPSALHLHTPTSPHPVCLPCSAGGRDRGGSMSVTWCSDNGSRCLITPNRQDHSEVWLILSPPEKLKLISGSPPPPKRDSQITRK